VGGGVVFADAVAGREIPLLWMTFRLFDLRKGSGKGGKEHAFASGQLGVDVCSSSDPLFYRHVVESSDPMATLVEEAFRWGVWLGRHICQTVTQVSQDELSEDRNLTSRKRAKARLISTFSASAKARNRGLSILQKACKVRASTLEVSEKLPQG